MLCGYIMDLQSNTRAVAQGLFPWKRYYKAENEGWTAILKARPEVVNYHIKRTRRGLARNERHYIWRQAERDESIPVESVAAFVDAYMERWRLSLSMKKERALYGEVKAEMGLVAEEVSA